MYPLAINFEKVFFAIFFGYNLNPHCKSLTLILNSKFLIIEKIKPIIFLIYLNLTAEFFIFLDPK